MLINTVILFLQNALPIFVMLTLLLILLSEKEGKKISANWLIGGAIVTVISTIMLSQNLETISQAFNGAGLELLLAIAYVTIYLFSIILFMFKAVNWTSHIGLILLFIIGSINGAHFIIYLTNYWSQTQQIESMLVGVVLGGGICLSISILLFFILQSADRTLHQRTSRFFLLLFSLGQLMHAIKLLQQVDLLSSSQPIWDSSSLITERNEVGQLLTVLFGYESTPSSLQLIIYLIGFIIPVIISKLTFIRIDIRGAKSC